MSKILVVDDNNAFTELIAMVFGRDHEVIKATDGVFGIESAGKHKPDLILMDVMMPRKSGIEMLRELQSEDDTRAIPVIVLTASNFDKAMVAMFEREPNVKGFLRKPCSVDVLRKEIRKVLGPAE